LISIHLQIAFHKEWVKVVVWAEAKEAVRLSSLSSKIKKCY